MSKIILYFFLVGIWVQFIQLPTYAAPLNPQFQHLPTSQLRANTIHDIIQDSLGFIWIAGSNGLYRYDGYSTKLYLKDKDVFTVHIDNQGRLWAGASNKLAVYFSDTDSFQNITLNLELENILTIFEDSQNKLWLGGASGLFSLEESSTGFKIDRHYQNNLKDESPKFIYKIRADREGIFWLATLEGLYSFDPKANQFTHYKEGQYLNGQQRVYDLIVDSKQTIWLATATGLYTLKEDRTTFTHHFHNANDPSTLGYNFTTALFEDSTGQIWVGTDKHGFSVFDSKSQEFTNYLPSGNIPSTLGRAAVNVIYQDNEGTIWVGMHNDGVYKWNPSLQKFKLYQESLLFNKGVGLNKILSMVQSDTNTVWIATDGGGLDKFDLQTETFTHYRHDPSNPNSLSSDSIIGLALDNDNNLWIGMWAGGLSKFNLVSETFTHYRYDASNSNSISTENIFSLYFDSQGILWISAWGKGLQSFNPRTGVFTTYLPDRHDPSTTGIIDVTAILEDHEGYMWFGGFLALERFDRVTQSFVEMTYGFDVLDIYQDQTQRLWLGTSNGLAQYDLQTQQTTFYTTNHGLASDKVVSILEDEDGYLWLGTNDGLNKFDTEKHQVFQNFSVSDGLQAQEFLRYAKLKINDGRLFFGGVNGFNIIDPQNIPLNSYRPPTVLTNFSLANKEVSIGENSILNQSLQTTGGITLTHKHNIFSIEFSALSYVASENNSYRYKLMGLENEWQMVSSSRRLSTYTNLDPGKYTFLVQGSNNDNLWDEVGAHLQITILPTWWQTIWFKTLGLVAIATFIFGVYLWRIKSISERSAYLAKEVTIRTTELSKANEQLIIAKNKAETANYAKSTFLAHMSHELRTPLNIILGYSQLLHHEGNLNGQQSKYVDTIDRSGQHLLGLINDVLELSKIEAGKVELLQNVVDLPSFMDNVLSLFFFRAKNKGLKFLAKPISKIPQYIITDERKLRQVLINLLGNAIKFTSVGQISLSWQQIAIEDNNCKLQFEIRDTGVGIAEEELSQLFEAFNQTSSSANAKEGTGLGLAIAQEFVELMGGSIKVESTLGVGSKFYFDIVARISKADIKELPSRLPQVISLSANETKRKILIVEDQKINRELLKRILLPVGFEVSEATNGWEGIKNFESFKPHLILMDLKMPRLDGYQTTKRIREMLGGKEVIILAVTANAFEEDRIKALEVGCNDFIQKPFLKTTLFTKIAQHLQVSFVYAQEKNDQDFTEKFVELILPKELSKQWLRELQESLYQTDVARAQEIINQLGTKHSQLAKQLTDLLKRYDYEQILDSITKVMSSQADS